MNSAESRTRKPAIPVRGLGLRRISDIAKPLAKRIIINAYCRGWLSKETTQELFRQLDLGGR